MSTMIERVAQRLYAEAGYTGWSGMGEAFKESYRRQARIAIEAMREPTEAMVAAAEAGDDQGSSIYVAPAAPEGEQEAENPGLAGARALASERLASVADVRIPGGPTLALARPAEQAVTEAMIMVASDQISEGLGAYLRKFADSDAAKQARYWLHKMPDTEWNGMARLLAEEALGAALKAAMEAGR